MPATLCAIVGVIAWFTYYTSGNLGIGTSARDRVYTPSDAAWAQLMPSALDVPLETPLSPSALLERATLAIAKGRRTALRDFGAVSAAASVGLFGALLITSGVAPLAVLLATIGFAVSANMLWHGVSWTYGMAAPAFALGGLLALAGWRQRQRRGVLIAGFIALAAACSEDTAWLCVLPGVVLWLRAQQRRADDTAILALAAIAAVCSIIPFVSRALLANRLASHLPGIAVPGSFDLWANSLIGHGGVDLSKWRTLLDAEFTSVGTVFAALGIAAALEDTRTRVVAATTALVMIAWWLLTPHTTFAPLPTPLVLAGWACVAFALHWIRHRTKRPFALAASLGVGIALVMTPVHTFADRAYPPGPDAELARRAQAAYDLSIRDLPANIAFVTESYRHDAELRLALLRAGKPANLLPQSYDAIAAAALKGQPIAAFTDARAHLARAGFLFERAWNQNRRFDYVIGRGQCTTLGKEAQDITPLLVNGSLTIHGPSPDVAPGPVTLQMRGVDTIPIRGSEPRSLRYEVTPAAADGDVTVKVPAPKSSALVLLNLSNAPTLARAAADGAAQICPGLQTQELMLGSRPGAQTLIRMTAPVFGSGWHTVEADPDFFRWTATDQAIVHVTLAPPGPIAVTVTATPAARAVMKPTIILRANACELQRQNMIEGQGDYEWIVPPECWRPGVNDIALGITPLVTPGEARDTRHLGARVGALRLRRLDTQNAK